MNWEAIGAVGEVLGAVAVFATLLYLIAQVRHARKELQQSIQQSSIIADREVSLELVRNPTLSRALDNANDSLEAQTATRKKLGEIADLADEEAAVLNSYLALQLREISHTIRDIDYFDEQRVMGLHRKIINIFGRGAGNFWFEALPKESASEAVKYIENVLAEREG